MQFVCADCTADYISAHLMPPDGSYFVRKYCYHLKSLRFQKVTAYGEKIRSTMPVSFWFIWGCKSEPGFFYILPRNWVYSSMKSVFFIIERFWRDAHKNDCFCLLPGWGLVNWNFIVGLYLNAFGMLSIGRFCRGNVTHVTLHVTSHFWFL